MFAHNSGLKFHDEDFPCCVQLCMGLAVVSNYGPGLHFRSAWSFMGLAVKTQSLIVSSYLKASSLGIWAVPGGRETFQNFWAAQGGREDPQLFEGFLQN